MKYYNDDDIDILLKKIVQGNTLLFIGAGFSTYAYNLCNESMPTAKELANKIAKKGNFNAEGDLFYAVEKFLEEFSKEELIFFLEEIFTVKSYNPLLKNILKFYFRRIYTTNYDDVIEKVSNDLGLYRKSIDAEISPKEYFKYLNICVHINGFIKNLNEKTFEKSFKLSESSYLEPDSFIRSQWWYSFKKDIEACSAIIFIGYSLYDTEIKKILYNKSFENKTFFITIKDIKEREIMRFKKFGKIVNIGIEGFSNLLKDLEPNLEKDDLKVFKKYEIKINDNKEKISDKDIYDLLTRGIVDKNKLINSIIDEDYKFYAVKRDFIDKIIDKVKEYNYIFITSEFGNGKSIFLEELKYFLYIRGYNVFELIDYELDFENDIKILNDKKGESIIFIDRYCDKLDILKYLQLNNNNKIKVILSDRTSNHYHAKKIFNNILLYELSIDILTENEIEKIINLISHIGEWGKYTNNKGIIKKRFEENYKKQISLFLLDIFHSEQIKQTIDKLVSPFIGNFELKKTFFSVLLLNLIDIEITKYLIEEVSGNDKIMNVNENEIFDKNLKIKSSLLSKYIISNYFTYSFVKEELLRIIEKAQEYKTYDSNWQKIERELLRFHFVEQIVTNEHKKIFLKQYFEELKSKNKLQWLKKEPHYWLQYAMGEMANKNLESAQKKLETAYSLASNKNSSYDYSYLDNQQARLYILFALEETNGKKIFDYFKKANNILSLNLDDRYNIKQIRMYKKLYDEKYKLLSKNDKKIFLNIIKEIYINILKIKEEARDIYIMSYEYNKCEIALKRILEKGNLLNDN
jgi:hypothetical protein